MSDAPRRPSNAGASLDEPDVLRVAAPSRDHDAPAFTAHGLADAMGGIVLQASERPIRGGAVDSRRVAPGNAFFALPGERTDGHRFLAAAVAAGAAALVVRTPPQRGSLTSLDGPGVSAGAPDVTIVQVPDGVAALQRAAAAWRARFAPLVVGVTGSLAKTSTKEQIAEVLAARWTTLRNEGNENNEIGLPLTLLRLGSEHRAAVLEMGMYVPGEIGTLARLASPRIGVVTAVRGTHLARAGSLDAIERGKRELVEALPSGGTAVLNADDERVARMASHVAPGVSVVTYGFGARADVSAEAVESAGEDGMRFVLRAGAVREPVATPALGRHSVHNALAAAAVGLAAGLEPALIASGLARGFRAPHRTALVRAGAWRILDDSYNAAPDSMRAALELLESLPGRRIAVLGEMLELGPASADAHATVGRFAARCADVLVAVGGASGIAAGALAAGMDRAAVLQPPDREAALAALIEMLRPGDVVLVKGSRGVMLDLLVDGLLAAAET